MECLVPGTVQRAGSPLEVTLSVQPTLVLQNALPYEMRVLLWQHLPSATAAAEPQTTRADWDAFSPVSGRRRCWCGGHCTCQLPSIAWHQLTTEIF